MPYWSAFMGKLKKAWKELMKATDALFDKVNELINIITSPPRDPREWANWLASFTRVSNELKAAATNASEKLSALKIILDELINKRGKKLQANKKFVSKVRKITPTMEYAKKILRDVDVILGKYNFARA
jgi:hypothetical protein